MHPINGRFEAKIIKFNRFFGGTPFDA